MDRQALVTAVVEPFEMGVVMSMFLFGGLCFQVWSYISEYNDRIFIKITVGLTCGNYIIAVNDGRTLWRLLELNLLPKTPFYFPYALCYRIHLNAKSFILPTICGILAFLKMTGIFGIAWVSRLHPNITPIQFKAEYNWLIIATLTLSACVDILVASALMTTLWKRRTGVLQQTQKMVDRVILWVFLRKLDCSQGMYPRALD
ncbi:hypothetical protein DL96DRAFT_1557220 [Flagelloscypha sp. PMI_526]|nr:hypothetical protein DL96DRAFT_1557220 [Flagelloscypha sp. PMI_526]